MVKLFGDSPIVIHCRTFGKGCLYKQKTHQSTFVQFFDRNIKANCFFKMAIKETLDVDVLVQISTYFLHLNVNVQIGRSQLNAKESLFIEVFKGLNLEALL